MLRHSFFGLNLRIMEVHLAYLYSKLKENDIEIRLNGQKLLIFFIRTHKIKMTKLARRHKRKRGNDCEHISGCNGWR